MRKPSWTSFSMIFLVLLLATSCVPTRGVDTALPADQNPIPAAITLVASGTPASDWLTFTNSKYSFQFKYPKEGQILDGGTDNYVRINLSIVPGTNLTEKYLEVIIVENANPCRSPLATSSIPQTSETVIINGISFLKETGEEGAAGSIYRWTAYSTSHDNVCVSLDFILRSANPDVFATPPPLYDEAAESSVFEQIVSAYVRLALVTGTPTFTSTSTPTDTPTTQAATPTETPMPPSTTTPTDTPMPTPTDTLTPMQIDTFTSTPDLINEQAVKLAKELAPQFSEIFRVQFDPSLAKGLDAARIGGPAGQLAGMIAPVIDGNQKYSDRNYQVREVEGLLSLNDSRLMLEAMFIINKGTIQYSQLPLGAYMVACRTDRVNDCLAISLHGEEFQIKPESISLSIIDQVQPPSVDYEEGSIRKCFKVFRRKICIRVFR